MGLGIKSLFVLCLLAICLPVHGVPYTAGNFTVDVVVRSTTMALIPDSKVSCWLDGKVIRLSAKAPGYLAKSASINVGAATYYKYDFVLPDIEKDLYAVDLNGVPIKAAYFEKAQYGFAGNVYGITVYIPKHDWPRPAPKRVDIFDQIWGGPWKTGCKINEVDEFYQVKMTMDRGALNWTGRRLLIGFDTSKKVSQQNGRAWFKVLRKLESDPKTPKGLAAAMGEFLSTSIPEDEANQIGEVPFTLQAYYSEAAHFASLHRDAPR